jgi:hypothetical protein
MRSSSITSYTSVSAALAAFLMAATPAQAETYETRLTAFVPTSCSADLSGSFGQIGENAFTLGSVNQYCNTRFQLSLSHGAVAQAGQLSFGGSRVSTGAGATVLKPMADPAANISEELVIYGFNAAEADEFRSALTVTVSPIAF